MVVQENKNPYACIWTLEQRVVYIRKTAMALVVALVFFVFAGCSPLAPEQVLSVRNRTTGQVVTLGRTRADVEKITGSDMENVMDFTEENVQRVSYWDAPGLVVDYRAEMVPDDNGDLIGVEAPEDEIVALRLMDGDKWEIAGGIRVGMTREKVDDILGENELIEAGKAGGVLLGYDEALVQVPFEEDAPYTVRISFEDDAVSVIAIQSNLWE